MNQLPPSTDEQMMPYIKQTKRSGTVRAIFIIAVAAIIIACTVLILQHTDFGKNIISSLFGAGKTPVETKDTTPTQPKPQKSIYDFDYSLLPAGEHGIVPADLSALNAERLFDNPQNKELTDDIAALPKLTDGKVRVLIVNTHPYEAYTDEVKTSYGDDFSVVGGDNTVKELGRKLALALIDRGIGAEYLDTEITSGAGSYAKAKEKISEKLLSEPDILYIFDIHRAVISDSAENLLRPVTEKDGKLYAQMNFVVGGGNENYIEEVKAVNTLTKQISENFPSLLMPAEISPSKLNQDVPQTVFTVEIGSCGNTYGEAQNTAEYLAEAFGNVVKSES